jgi:Tol biopolymer transport system component
MFALCAVATWAPAQPGPRDPAPHDPGSPAPASPVPGSLDPGLPTQPADASPRELRVLGGRTDYSIVKPNKASSQELPTWRIPNVPSAAEAYYAPDNYHVIAQTQDPDGAHAPARTTGALTWIFSDDGKTKWRVNDRGQDLCSYFFPDGKHVIFTSTRDHMDLPLGNVSDERNYPQGAELYVADIDGGNRKRLTYNANYDAEVSISPDGKRIVFSRQVDGALDLYMMNVDGTGERKLTDTPDWQEGAPFFLPDSKTITTRAWSRATYGTIRPTPMTIFTIDVETGERVQRTHDNWMNWAPYPAPDGRHYVFVRPLVDNPANWEIFLGDLEGGQPVRLTFNDSFDGFPSLSPDGTKMLFARSEGPGFMAGLYTYVMDVSSLNIGPKPALSAPSPVRGGE